MHHVRNVTAMLILILCAAAIMQGQGGLTANAGPDQNDALVGGLVSLSGSGSQGTTTYAWAFTSKPSGSSAALSGAATATPTFTPDRRGTYVVRLTVGNGTTTASDTVSITTVNRPPEADAGADAALAVGKSFTLNGTGSFDPDNDRLTYLWSIVSAPPSSAGVIATPTKSKAKLILDRAGTYVVQLVVKDGTLTSAPDQAVITTANTIPVANAGPDRVVALSALTELDGTGSSDLDGDELTYSWKLKKPTGSHATLSSPAGPRPGFLPDVNGSYVATLTVSDGVRTKTDTVTITTIANLAPVARAGRDHPALVAGQKIVLDGSASTDANGDLLTYAWTITKRPGASAAALGSPTAVRSTFTADVKGSYTFTLTATDPLGAVSTDQIVYSAAPPASNAGPDQSVLAGATVVLDGSASSHLTRTLWYGWSLVSSPVGSTATLDDPTDPQPRFLADLPGTYVAQLIVFDGALLGAADTVVVSAGTNAVPRIALGPDQVVPTSTIVTLDSTAVTDPDPGALSFRWALIARPAGSSAAVSSPTGGVTQLTIDVAGAYVVQLIAADQNGGSSTGTVVIATAKGRPLVTVGPDRSATAGVSVPLAATIAEPDGTGVAVEWRLLLQPDDSSAAIVNPASSTPSFTPDVDGVYVAQVIVRDPDGLEAIDALVIRTDEHVVVTIAATDTAASEAGPDPGTFTFTRSGDPTSALTGVAYTRSGTATAGTDYTPSLPASGTVNFAAGQATTTVTITPVNDGPGEGDETVVLTLVDGAAYDLGDPSTRVATVTITDVGGCLLPNGAMNFGSISSAGEVDTCTFTAAAGARIALHIGEIVDVNGFVPWIRLQSPAGVTIANTWGTEAAAIEAVAPVSGTYTVLVASNDGGFDATGTYRLTMVHTPPPIVVSPGDQGGPLGNGGVHTGEILRGDVDVWTVTMTAGDRITLHLGEVTDDNGFVPWIRLWSPTGAEVAETWGNEAAAIEAVAPVTGSYLVMVASNDGGYDATGTYRLETMHTPGPPTITPGDQGGPLVNGSVHMGAIVRGDVDVWTVTMTAGDRITLHLGEVTDDNGFVPWIRLWSPTGVEVAETWGNEAAAIEAVAPVTGSYLVMVASNDGGYDATGTYRLETMHTPGPPAITPGDQGGPLVNGSVHMGAIVRGDVDVWTVTMTAGDRITLHLGEVTDDNGFVPWIRLWSPTGVEVAETWGNEAAAIEAVAPVTGSYLVMVASNDGGYDATGTYRLETMHTPGPPTITAGDEGGALTNGAIHTGAIVRGDNDVWTIGAIAGQHVTVTVNEVVDSTGFVPWIRLWSPTGVEVAETWGLTGATISAAVAPVTGTYLVMVASNDGGYDAAGTYSLQVTVGP